MRPQRFLNASNLCVEDVEYLIKKANRFGLIGKEITFVYEVIEHDHKEFLFEVKRNNFLIETENA